MVVYNHDIDRVPPFKLFVHTGIMMLNLHPLGQHIKSVRGEETHCGLVRLDPDGSVQFLTYADLSKPENKVRRSVSTHCGSRRPGCLSG